MFIIVFLLTLLTIPRVLLKPTVIESEFDDTLLDDETRSKRQAQFFELLHQAIEKYANCANEHLAPLRALANYKQYETFVYPESYSQSSQPLVGATNNRNKPKVKCTKVNLCSIEPPRAQSNPRYNTKAPLMLGRSQDPKSGISQENRRYFPYNPKNYGRLPYYGNNRSRNMPPSYNPRYSYGPGNKNFSTISLNPAFFNQFLYGPSLANRKGIVITPTNESKVTDTLGSSQTNGKPSGEFKSCGCTKTTTEKPLTTIENLKQETLIISENKEGLNKSSSSTTTEAGPILGTIKTNLTSPAKTKSCSCLKKTTPNPQTQPIQNLTSTESDTLLGSSNGNTTPLNKILNSSSQILVTGKPVYIGTNDPHSNQNLNLLFLQLDIMAHNESKEDLKQILQKLNALKSALKITEPTATVFSSSTEEPSVRPTILKSTSSLSNIMTNTTTISSTTAKVADPLLENNATTKVQESPLVAATEPALISTQVPTKEPVIVNNITKVITENDNSYTIKSVNDTANLQLQKSNHLNNTNINQTDNSNLEPNKTISKTTTITHSIHTAQKSGNNSSQLLKAIEEFSQNLNLNETDEITAIASSPALQLNITNSQDLARITQEMHTLVDSMANKTNQGTLQQHHNNSGQSNAMNITIIRQTIASTNNKTTNGNITIPDLNIEKLISKDHSQDVNLLIRNFNGSTVPHSLNHTNNGSFTNSTITISIASNGSFNKIQVEQQSASDKNLEINEKEKINMGTSKIRSNDMKATDSRHVKYLQKPQRKDHYTEPILSEIYPIKTKTKTKTPLSIYWHKIEEKPLKIKKIPSKNLQIFQSDDYDDDDEDEGEDSESGAEENLSILLKECDDFEDITDYEDSDSVEGDRKSSFRDLCRHISYFT